MHQEGPDDVTPRVLHKNHGRALHKWQSHVVGGTEQGSGAAGRQWMIEVTGPLLKGSAPRARLALAPEHPGRDKTPLQRRRPLA
jgi:hypothetical protein